MSASAVAHLLIGLLFSGLSYAQVSVTEPEPGAVIAGLGGDQDVKFFCRVELDGTEQATTWSIQREGDSAPRAITTRDFNFFITGNPIPGTPFNFNTNLTILILYLEFNNSLVFCGTQGDLHSVNFTILVYAFPYSPPELQVERVDKNSAHFTWKPAQNPGAPPLTSYQLLLIPLSGSMEETITVNVSATDTEATVTGLLPGTAYFATICASYAMLVGLCFPIRGSV